MATSVKVVVRDGHYGLILHKHGNSAWHPANEVHSDRLGHEDKDNGTRSHAEHKAGDKAVITALKAMAKPEEAFKFTHEGVEYEYALTADWLENEYNACLQGTTQLFWNIQWKAKLAARKAKKAAAESGEGEEAEEEDKVLVEA